MKRAEILEAARVCVCGERQQDYGTPENNFETIGLLWGVYLRASHPELAKVMAINHINAKDVATMMGLLKVARIATYEYLVLSYNSEGIMPQHNILDVLSQYGEVE